MVEIEHLLTEIFMALTSFPETGVLTSLFLSSIRLKGGP